MKKRLPPPILALVTALLMWGLSQLLSFATFSFDGQSLVAIEIIAVGVAFDLFAVAHFVQRRTTVNPLRPSKASSLVVTGLFRWTRNPMYVGMVFILTGVAVWLGNPLNALLVIGFAWFLTATQIKAEEAAMTQLFGDEWLAYCKRVRRWL